MRTFATLTLLFVLTSYVNCQEGTWCSSDDTNSEPIYCLNGACTSSGTCKCSHYFSGDNCDIYFQESLGTLYIVYFFYQVIAWPIATAYLLYKWIRFYQSVPKLDMRHVGLGVITLGSFLRVVTYFITVDLDWQRNIDLQPLGALTFYFWYPCVISAYTMEILLWLEMFSSSSYQPIQNLPRLRKFFIVTNAIVFPLELSVRIAIFAVDHNPLVSVPLNLIWIGYLLIIWVVEGSLTLYIGMKALRKLKNMILIVNEESKNDTIQFITRNTIIITILSFFALTFLIASAITLTNQPVFYSLAFIARFIELVVSVFFGFKIRPPEKAQHSTYQSSQSSVELNSSRKI